MNGADAGAPQLSAIGKALFETSLSVPDAAKKSGESSGTTVKRERTDSLKQMLPSPAAQRSKSKTTKPTPIVTTYLEPTPESGPNSLSSARGGDKSNPRRWSKAEDESLRLAVERSGERNWKAIADQVVGRNHTQCLQRWTKVLKPGLIKGHWTPEEDAKLRALVAEGRKNWGQVASHIPGRTSKQCRERWCNHLDPNINKGNYTREEDQLIIDMQAKLGNRWSVIAQQLTGRTEDAVKIRWKSLMRTKRTRDKEDAESNNSDDSAPTYQQPQQPPPHQPPAAATDKGNVAPKSRVAKQTTPKGNLQKSPAATVAPLRQNPTTSSSPRHSSFYIPNPTMLSRPTELPSEIPHRPTANPPHIYGPPRHEPLPRHPSLRDPPYIPPLPSSFTKQYPRMPPPPAGSSSSSYSMPYMLPPPLPSSSSSSGSYDQPPPPAPGGFPYPFPTSSSSSLPHQHYHQLPPSLHRLPSASREEWGTSHTPRSQLISNEGQVSEYELFHQQRLRLMVQERERAGPTLSPAASPGQAMLTKELEANSERQKRQAIMQSGWKNAVDVSEANSEELVKAPSEYEEERYDGFFESKETHLGEIDPSDDSDYRSRVALPPLE
ncbi:unnamed protein product [Aphanomyces euteiches]|uniref:Uncharacterized protein n=1 Tax=Aphanomyces euteiches TaxID=100861 RepID=A0A6G0XBC5_9STRA|nr:hypothetical protein Ae201684_006484 [Aphanomyces euteiches]KAH9091145.1 hypothetical protein Ae201684P_006545 [Aphanomyces euteiches]KAH9133520.1 hypothetical protein AeRB84_020423 [Aphanomyces euteiches]